MCSIIYRYMETNYCLKPNVSNSHHTQCTHNVHEVKDTLHVAGCRLNWKITAGPMLKQDIVWAVSERVSSIHAG